MKIPILLPKIGESTQEATILQWHKNIGDFVHKDDILVELSTDKVNSDLPSEFEGRLIEILINENEIVKVGEAICIVECEDDIHIKLNESKIKLEQETIKINTEKANKIQSKKLEFKTFLSPVVRNLIKENDISIEELEENFSNKKRICKRDIEQLIEQKNSLKNKKLSIRNDRLQLDINENDTVQSLSVLRKKIAENIQNSYQIIPHVTTFIEINVTNIVQYRNKILDEFFAENNQKITYTHILMFCTIQSLKAFPEINSWFNVDEHIIKGNINLGFATALSDGNLIVPNVKSVENMSLSELVFNVNETANKARENKLKPDDLQHTTFTVSNTGIFGSLMGTPIIIQPQVAILALGQIHKGIDLDSNDKPIRIEKMYASLSYDHRIIDGALASKFLTYFKNKVESFTIY